MRKLIIICYKADKKVLDKLREIEDKKGKTSEIKFSTYKIKEYVLKADNGYLVKRYFNSKDYVYILTASSRTGETAVMKRFFDSLIFNPESKMIQTNTTNILFSALKATPIDFNPNLISIPDPPKPEMPAAEQKDLLKLAILSNPIPSFVAVARQKNEHGTIQLKITFSKDCWVSKIEVVKTLKFGLLRQAVFAALRIKFLPEEKNNQELTVTKRLEYSFAIY